MSSQAISPSGDRSAMRKHWLQKIVILVGLEPTIPGSLGRCLIHWATGPLADLYETRCHDDDTAQLNNDDVTAQLRAGCPQLPTEFHKTSIPPSTWWLPARWTVRWWGSGHRPMFYPLGYRPRAEFHKISTPPTMNASPAQQWWCHRPLACTNFGQRHDFKRLQLLRRSVWGWWEVDGWANRWIKNEAREIRTPNLLIWSQTRCRCAIAPCCESPNTAIPPNPHHPSHFLENHILKWKFWGASKRKENSKQRILRRDGCQVAFLLSDCEEPAHQMDPRA